MEAIIIASFAVALLLVAECAAKAKANGSLRVGPPSWDVRSWATNITVLGGLFGTFFGNAIVPNPRFVPNPGYPMLSVLFTALALIAPLLFLARSDVEPVNHGSVEEIQHQGTAIGFLIAMLLTLWAALGQLATLGALGAELRTSEVATVAWVFLFVLLVAAIAIVRYARSTLLALLDRQKNAATSPRKKDVGIGIQELVKEPDPTKAPLPSWPLL